MKKKLIVVVIFSIFNLHSSICRADSLDVKVHVGHNIGGTAPLPMPASIRSIDAFRLTPSPCIGANFTFHLSPFTFSVGLYLENKGMDADVTVKSYSMEMKKGASQISGLFTGHVSQQVTQWMLTLPLQATWSPSYAVTFKFGPYFSLLLKKEFSGIASSGYLRQGDPTGPRIEIGNKEGEWATYDFSNEMRTLQWGLSFGLDWQIVRHVGLSANLKWGLSGIFNSDFMTVEQTLYPIYGSIGLFYRL